MSSKTPIKYSFGDFLLDIKGHQLWHNEEQVKLTPKAFETLVALVKRSGELVTKDELLDEIWSDTFVEEGSLTRNISVLRKVFKPNKYIETVPRKGYRFVADVEYYFEEVQNKENIKAPEDLLQFNVKTEEIKTDVKPEKSRFRWHLAVIILLGMFLVTSFSLWVSFKDSNEAAENNRTSSNDLLYKNQVKSIAVLPPKGIGNIDQEKAFSIGLTDDLISRLGRINRFVVRPLSSVENFNDSGKSATLFGKELKVDAVLVGTFQKQDDRLRINVQLLDVKSGTQIWSSRFDKNEKDIFKLQDELSVQVAAILINKLTNEENSQLKQQKTNNFDAYSSYSKGQYFLGKRTTKDIEKAISHFKEAVKFDANFSDAYVGLADCYLLLSDSDFGEVSPLEVKDEIELNLKKAIELNPNSAKALTSLALSQWNLREAEENFKKAISISPNLAKAHHWYAWNLIAQKRFNEAESHMKLAKELNPTSKIIASDMGIPWVFKGEYDKAIKYFRDAIELDKNYPEAHFQLWYALHYAGRNDEATKQIKVLEKLTENEEENENYYLQIMKGLTNIANGNTKKAEQIYKNLQLRKSKGEYISPVTLAPLAAELGDMDEAYKYLQAGLKERNDYLQYLEVSPEFKKIREDSRYGKFVTELSLF